MHKKDYQLIASKLHDAYIRLHHTDFDLKSDNGFLCAYHAVVDALSEDNPQFSAERFYEAVFEKEECIDD